MQLKGSDAVHRSVMSTILIAIADDPVLSHGLIFKGGTCAMMLEFLDRFSVDLDFDLVKGYKNQDVQKSLESVFSKLSLPIVQKHPSTLMYKVRYSDDPAARKTIKVSVNEDFVASSTYQPQYLAYIDRTMICQTRESMVAQKMIALTQRFEKRGIVAGRDVYDIHHFLLSGYAYSVEVIRERTGMTMQKYIAKMISFIETRVNQRAIDEDINLLLPVPFFKKIRKILIPETTALLRAELERLKT